LRIAFAALGWLVAAYLGWNGWAAGRRAAYWQGEADATRAKLGAACAPVYGVWWIERTCPGIAGWALPAPLQALACPGRVRTWRGDLEGTRARAEALGASSAVLLLEEKGPKERELPLKWRAEVTK